MSQLLTDIGINVSNIWREINPDYQRFIADKRLIGGLDGVDSNLVLFTQTLDIFLNTLALKQRRGLEREFPREALFVRYALKRGFNQGDVYVFSLKFDQNKIELEGRSNASFRNRNPRENLKQILIDYRSLVTEIGFVSTESHIQGDSTKALAVSRYTY